MGETAELLVRELGISREEQDAYALLSHRRAASNRERLREEIMPVYAGSNVIEDDNGVRGDSTPEALARLRPMFDKRFGTITAGNASQVTDGACALLVMSEAQAKTRGLQPLGYLRSYSRVALDPARMGLGPAQAIPAVLKRSGVAWRDIQLLEINEAFAAQIIAVERRLAKEHNLEINRDILNVNGGAIALGHPVGVSGARLALTLLKEMHRRNLNLGLVALCVGGGQGMAAIFER